MSIKAPWPKDSCLWGWECTDSITHVFFVWSTVLHRSLWPFCFVSVWKISLYKAKFPYVCLCICLSACQAMAAPTAAPIVTKFDLQTLNITSLKLIPPHLTFEAVFGGSWGPKFRLLQRPDGHAIGIGKPLGNSCAGPVLSAGIYGKRRGGKKVMRGGHWARKTTQAELRLDPETHGPLPSLSWGGSEECPDQPVSKVKTKWIWSGSRVHGECQGWDQLSFESRPDQLRVECEARVEREAHIEHETHVELWSSLLVGRIAARVIKWPEQRRAPLLVSYE